MASDTDLTQKRLQELLHYDPETGVFTWLPRAYVVAAQNHSGEFANGL